MARVIAPPGDRPAIHCVADARDLAFTQHIAVVALFEQRGIARSGRKGRDRIPAAYAETKKLRKIERSHGRGIPTCALTRTSRLAEGAARLGSTRFGNYVKCAKATVVAESAPHVDFSVVLNITRYST